MNPLSVPYQVTRLIFDVGQPYEKFRSRYEAAVPVLDPQWLGEYAGRHIRSRDTIAESDEPSAHGFVLYWRGHLSPLMTEGGEQRPCTAYLMGLPDIQENAYRRDPAVMLHVPLRTLIYIDGDDQTRFAVDQPSTVLASFADPDIADYGLDLDRRLADLLGALGVKASPALAGRQAQVPSPRLGQRSSAERRAGRAQP